VLKYEALDIDIVHGAPGIRLARPSRLPVQLPSQPPPAIMLSDMCMFFSNALNDLTRHKNRHEAKVCEVHSDKRWLIYAQAVNHVLAVQIQAFHVLVR